MLMGCCDLLTLTLRSLQVKPRCFHEGVQGGGALGATTPPAERACVEGTEDWVPDRMSAGSVLLHKAALYHRGLSVPQQHKALHSSRRCRRTHLQRRSAHYLSSSAWWCFLVGRWNDGPTGSQRLTLQMDVVSKGNGALKMFETHSAKHTSQHTIHRLRRKVGTGSAAVSPPCCREVSSAAGLALQLHRRDVDSDPTCVHFVIDNDVIGSNRSSLLTDCHLTVDS